MRIEIAAIAADPTIVDPKFTESIQRKDLPIEAISENGIARQVTPDKCIEDINNLIRTLEITVEQVGFSVFRSGNIKSTTVSL